MTNSDGAMSPPPLERSASASAQQADVAPPSGSYPQTTVAPNANSTTPLQQPSAGKGLSTGALIGIIGGAVAVMTAAIIVVAHVFVSGAAGPGAPGKASTPSDAVSGYLNAIAKSDAEGALAFLAREPSDSSLLSPKALKASNKLAPITKISVDPPKRATDYGADVTVRFSVGSAPVKATYRLVKDQNGDWKLSGATSLLSFGKRFDGLEVTVNGVVVDTSGDGVDVFPGTYELATSSPNFAIGGKTSFTVKTSDDYPSLWDAKVTLSEEGLGVYRSLIQEALDDCLSATTLEAGCGLAVPATLSDGTVMVDGTIARELDAEGQARLAALKPDDAFTDVIAVKTARIGHVQIVGDCVKGGVRSRCSVFFGPSLSDPVVDFSTKPPTLRWE